MSIDSTYKNNRNKKQRIMLTLFITVAAVLFVSVFCFAAYMFFVFGRDSVLAAASDISYTEEQPETDTLESVESLEKTEESTEELTTIEYIESVYVEIETEAPVYVDIVAVGDNLIHKEIDVTVVKDDGSYSFDGIFTSAVRREIASADLAIINQEVPCAGNQYEITGYPSFNAPTEILDTVHRLGFDVVTLATNHSLDKGELGLVNTLNYLSDKYPDILTTGTFRSFEEYMTIPVTEVNGVKIAVLNYTYGTNGYPLPNNYCLNLLENREKAADDIRRAKEYADFIIVAPHWGIEYQLQPSKEQRELAQFFADCGADLIIGTHPHVVQPMEWIKSEDGRDVLVYYSLGNFLSAQQYSPRSLGGMAKVRLEVNDGEVSIVDSTMDFTITYFTADLTNSGKIFDNFRLFMLKDFPEELVATYGLTYWSKDFTLQDYYDIAKSIVPEW